MNKITKFLIPLLAIGLLTGCGGTSEEKGYEGEVTLPSGKTYKFDDVDPLPHDDVLSVVINNENDLKTFRDKVNQQDENYLTAYVELNNDISLKDNWTPINGFKGQFNGNDHKITNLKISSSTLKNGFFSSIENAKIGCLTINGEINTNDISSMLVSHTSGDCIILDTIVEGSIKATNYVGGLVGTISSGSLKVVGCVNKAIIRGESYVGGLVGSNKTNKINISDSINYGKVYGTNSFVGGIIASLTNSTDRENDYNLYQCYNTGTVKGPSYVGGVVGLSCSQLIQCGVTPNAKTLQIKEKEEIEATTLTSFVSPFCSIVVGNLLYNPSINQYGEMIECENKDGFTVTGINNPAGCTRLIKYQGNLMLFAATNKYAVSTDGGHTFGAFTTISDKATEICPIDGEASTDTGNTQPYELPDGRIAMFYRAIRVATSFSYGSLRMRISDEHGHFNSGDEPITLIENYTTNTGTAGAFYEPYPILLDDGTIAIYISEDVHYTNEYNEHGYHIDPLRSDLVASGGSQNTVMIPLKVAPGATELGAGKIEIGEYVLIFRGSNTSMFGHENSRPGMTVITQLYDKSYAMILEDSTEQHNPGYNLVVQITYSKDGRTWTAPQTIIRPHQKGGERNGDNTLFKCCAPFIATLPDGRLVIVCATDEDYAGLFPTDDAHYKHEYAFITKNRIGYGDKIERDNDLIQVGNYVYSENEYCVWASVAFIDGRIYVSGLQGVNYQKDDGTTASPTGWILISSIDYLKLYERIGLTPLA